MTLYGNTKSSGAFPFGAPDFSGCPLAVDEGWVKLGSVTVSGKNQWVKADIDFTPLEQINAVVVGPNCSEPRKYYDYYYIDDLILNKTSAFDDVIIDEVSGTPCSENVVLGTNVPEADIAYQWYRNDIAIPAATEKTLTIKNDPSSNAVYKVRISRDGNCQLSGSYTFGYTSARYLEAPPPVGLCEGDSLVLKVRGPEGASFLWSDGGVTDSMVIRHPGSYSVTTTVDGCQYANDTTVGFKPLPDIDLGPDKDICTGGQVALGHAVPGATYRWNTGARTAVLTTAEPGQYADTVTVDGCSSYDVLTVTRVPPVAFDLGADTSLCEGTSLALEGPQLSDVTYAWSTGDQSSGITLSGTGKYWLDVTRQGCVNSDTIGVTFRPLPQPALGDDTTLCQGTSLLLELPADGISYTWQDGSPGSSYQVTAPGDYSVTADEDGCTASDAMHVNYMDTPVLDLQTSWSYCLGDTITLTPGIKDASYRWPDGSTGTSYQITRPGTYSVTATNACGTDAQTITAIQGICNVYVPTAFSPNGDGINDLFRVRYGEPVSDFRLQVYDRWGKLMFQTAHISEGWNGKCRNIPQPVGGYVWTLSYTDDRSGKEVHTTGAVTLVR